jgi:MFS family permease
MIVLALVVAVAAAVRSTWSPCGVSMLSTLVPLAEQGRGHRWSVTAVWFVAGAVLGGLTLGLLAAPVAAVVAGLDPTSTAVAALTSVTALVALASDERFLGFRLPSHTRQVNEDWAALYRPWVYAGGWGWQIGVGVATFTVTAGLGVMVVASILTGDPVSAIAVGLVFGLVRGLMVFLGARLDSPARLRTFHRRFEAAREPSRVAMSLVLLAAAVASGAVAAGWVGVAFVGAVVALAAAVQQAQTRVRTKSAARATADTRVVPV